MNIIENISYDLILGNRQYMFEVYNEESGDNFMISLPAGKYDNDTVITHLIRSRYTQDQVEAIINNHFIKISEWIDSKMSGDNKEFDDPEYTEFQEWRAESKRIAKLFTESIK